MTGKRLFTTILLALCLCAINQKAIAADVFEFNKKLGNGINLGNALDAPKEGDWGVVLKPEYFRQIKEAGFDHVRLPVRWSAHTDGNGHIDPTFMARVDWALQQAKDNNLAVVINMHHYEELEKNVSDEAAKFLNMWQEIADHLKVQGESVAFEIYNEPSKSMTAEIWNDLFPRVLSIIRRNNRSRPVVIGPVQWNSISQLDTLRLPADPNLIVTVHYYEPFHFTHQGAEWVGQGKESDKWLGTTWNASAAEMQAIDKDFSNASDWSSRQNRPIYLGEYGAYSKADMASRVRWTKAVRELAIKHGFSRSYWEFCSGFGAFDAQANEWRKPLLEALTCR